MSSFVLGAILGGGTVALHAADPPKIALREGLTVVTALSDSRGDYESIKQVTLVDPQVIRISYAADLPPGGDPNGPLARLLGTDCQSDSGRSSKNTRVTALREIRREDLERAHEYRYLFHTCGAVGKYPGATAIGLSASVLRELRAQGRSRISVVTDEQTTDAPSDPGSLLNTLAASGAAATKVGDMMRVEAAAVPFSVLVNDQPVELPAIHVRGKLGDLNAELWVLDDEANPLSLKWSIGNQRLQVVKIALPPERPTVLPAEKQPSSRIERELAAACRADVYGIYFDFASDGVKPQSEPVLADIAAALQHNPSWKLTVDGHTDNIGGDFYNLDLSRRRAAAVKQALVSGHRIAADRVQTSGYGASRPKDTNATVEGRARNRRVELTRGC